MQNGAKTAYHDMVNCAVDSFYNQTKHLFRLWGSVAASAATTNEIVEIVTNEVLENLNNDGHLPG